MLLDVAEGARRLKDGILPLTLRSCFKYNNAVPAGGRRWGKPPVLFTPFNPIKTIVQNSIDVRLNRIYDEIDAYVLAPRPLAYTENDKTQARSTLGASTTLRLKGPPSRPG